LIKIGEVGMEVGNETRELGYEKERTTTFSHVQEISTSSSSVILHGLNRAEVDITRADEIINNCRLRTQEGFETSELFREQDMYPSVSFFSVFNNVITMAT